MHGFRAPGGQVKFSRRDAWVDRPVTVSCGQCSSCRLERSRQWALRCVHEAQMHERNCFLTLTYDPKHLPADGSLDVSHWQKFARRLRKNIGPFRFLHCGEYGEENRRPHYHACVFGMDFRSDMEVIEQKKGYDIWTFPTAVEQWSMGRVAIGNLTFDSAAYVARYIMKKVSGPPAEEHYGGLKPEYVTMSRRPGLGARWFERYSSDVYPDDFVVHDNRKFRPPVFYDRELEKRDPALLEVVKRKRVVAAKQHVDDQTPDRLLVREIVTDARLSQLGRDV